MEPLKRIPFQIAGRLTIGDVFRYQDPYVYVTTQFGYIRINALTGEYRVRTGIGYNNPIFPPSDIGVNIVGDFNQSVSQLAVGNWIVTDNLANSTAGRPSALVWRDDEDLSFHGFIEKKDGFWWERSGEPLLSGHVCRVPNDRGTYDAFDCESLTWIGHDSALGSPGGTSVRGFTYGWQPLDGSGQSQYELVRTDVAVEQPPAPAPSPAPPPAPQPTPTPIEEPPMPTKPPAGTPPVGTPPPYTPPPTPNPAPPTTGQDLLVSNGRFRLSCRFTAPDSVGGADAPALATRLSDIAGYFTFFSADNVEVVVKYADLSSIAMPRRFFVSAMTDVSFTLTITDTTTAESKKFLNPMGNLLGELLDFPAAP